MIDFLQFHPITATAIVVFAVALWKGGLPERIGAAMMIAEWLLEETIDRLAAGTWVATTPTVFCDFLLACGLLAIAIRFGKLWLGVSMILQGVTLAMHALALGDDAPGYNLYVAVLNVTTSLLLMSLLSGSITAWVRRAARRRSLARGGLQPAAAAG
ncbi:MAG: hypothetical protein INR64_06925 [Caulobacteraceae bacterium]|nr:hypothetical protein [Caulobacter sp.]